MSRAQLLNWTGTDDAPADALTARQLSELKKGVRAAIDNGEARLGVPGSLTDSEWHHAGVGVSVYMHRSGVVVMQSEGDTLVTDADTIDHMNTARVKFMVRPGSATVATSELDGEGQQ